MKKDVVDRISEVISIKKISVRLFAEQIGIPQTTLNNYILRKRGLSLDVVIKILNSFGFISAEWLLRGEGEMLKEQREGFSPHQIVPTVADENSLIYKLYQEEKEENKSLLKQNTILEERIRQLEADNESLRSQSGADRITDTFTDLPLVDYEEDYPPVERPSSSKHPLAGKA